MYKLSIPLESLPNHFFEVGEVVIPLGALQIELRKTTSEFRVSVSGFADAEAARAYAPHLRASLAWALIKDATTIPKSFDIEEPSIPQGIEPTLAAKNVCESFGMPFDGKGIDGIIDANAAYIVKTRGSYFKLAIGSAGISITNQLSALGANIHDGLTQVKNNLSDENVSTALELYKSSFLESSARARFFSLIMCLEVLSTDTLRPPSVVDLLNKWKGDLKVVFNKKLTEDERAAFEAIQNTVIHQRHESIRKRIYNFVNATLESEGKEKALIAAKRAREIYDIRSTLAHKGSVDLQEFNRALEDLKPLIEHICKAILIQC